MDTNEIQRRLDAMPAAMSAKGKIKPEANVFFSSNAEPSVHLTWRKKADDWHSTEYFHAEKHADIGVMLDEAEQFIRDLPSKEQEQHRQFLQALSDAIEIGKMNGIDVAHVNPLVEQMKALSKNAISFTPKPYAPASNDIPF